jgi:hypothetical protein
MSQMPFTVFVALCVLGCDLLLYIFFQWIYGEKYRARTRRLAVRRKRGPILSDLDTGDRTPQAFSNRTMNYKTGSF